MAAVTVPGGVVAGGSRRSLVGVILAGIVGLVKRRRKKPHTGNRPGMIARMGAFIRDMVGSTAGFAALVYALFQLGSVAGWMGVGVAILLLDFQRESRAAARRGGRT